MGWGWGTVHLKMQTDGWTSIYTGDEDGLNVNSNMIQSSQNRPDVPDWGRTVEWVFSLCLWKLMQEPNQPWLEWWWQFGNEKAMILKENYNWKLLLRKNRITKMLQAATRTLLGWNTGTSLTLLWPPPPPSTCTALDLILQGPERWQLGFWVTFCIILLVT